MEQNFIESVKRGDVKDVRLSLSNELLLDPRGKSFTEMLSYAEANLSNLFEENKEAGYDVLPKEQWDENFMFKVKNDLDFNFSVEKLAFYQAVIEVVGKDKMASLDEEEISLDTISREDGSNSLSEETRVVTAVMAYNNRKVLLTWESLEDVVSKALCSHTNDIFVHSVGTCAHNTAQTTSTELQVLIESIYEC